ncbi:MAG TPA: DNA primase [Candidatus Saccharimonadales bacterium]|nr:DNA primase [Candidatus Saccharimonadales bacterium]
MDAVDEVKNRLNIEDVVSEYVQLKRAGRNWKGLSPFSEERTPSFMVSPEKQIWHDFSSGKGGNVFSFIMEVEGLTFKEALELLARKAGVDLEQYRTPGQRRGPNKERLYELLEAATKFYQVQFSRHRETLEYVLKKRQFSKETALEWRIGYSPNSGDALVKFLKTKGFTDAEMKQAGVTAQRYRGVGDMFRGRVMIPLCDQQGRVIGFTARLLRDDPNAPKYINTPQTPLYDKSRHIFGLHLAKEAIRKGGYVVVAEGNLDVIASHQAGIRQVVATAGTALTEQHLQGLSRFTGDIRLSFDADKAGLNATERAIPIASKTKVSLSIITIPSGKDPDELIKQDPEIWKKVIEAPQYAVDWLIERYQSLLNMDTGAGKRQFSDVILQVVKELQDPVEQDHYVTELAHKIGVSPDALRTKLHQTEAASQPQRQKRVKIKPQQFDKAYLNRKRSQDLLLGIALMRPKLRSIALDILPEMLIDQDAHTIFDFLRAHPDFREGEDADELRPIVDYVKILEDQFEDWDKSYDLVELQNNIVALQKNLLLPYKETRQKEINEALANASDPEKTKLRIEYKDLEELLRLYKKGA